MADYKKPKSEEENNHQIPIGDRNRSQWENIHDEYGNKVPSMARFDQKTIIFLLGCFFAITNGYFVHRISTEFDARFEKSIKHYEYRISILEEDMKIIKTQILKILVEGKK